MGYEYYKKALKLIKENEGLLVKTKGAELEVIQLAEKKLGVKFPEVYKQFLKDFGYLNFEALQVFGIVNNELIDESGVPDGIWYTLDERLRYNFPNELLIIADFGIGELYCLDLSSNNEYGKVIAYIPGYDDNEQIREVIADNFGEFLYKQIEEEIEFEKQYEKQNV